MELLNLREFVDLAKTCNFMESAENLFISASTLSKHIKKMEEELGVPLFDRSTRTVTLSKYGKILLPYAMQITGMERDYLRDIQNVKTIDDNQLNIGFLPMLGRFGVIEFLSQFCAEHPNLTVNITESSQLEEALLEHKFDFVFTDSIGPQSDKTKRILFKTDHLVAIFPPKHPLAGRKSIRIKDMQDEHFILKSTAEAKLTITSQKFIKICQENGFEPNVAAMTRYVTTIARYIEQGKGVGILYSSEIADESHFDFSVVKITPAIPFDIMVGYLPSRMRSESAALFLEYLNKHTAEKVE